MVCLVDWGPTGDTNSLRTAPPGWEVLLPLEEVLTNIVGTVPVEPVGRGILPITLLEWGFVTAVTNTGLGSGKRGCCNF